MAASPLFSLALLFSALMLSFTVRTVSSATFTLVNQCTYTVWPGLLSGAGTQPLSTTGFALNSGDSFPITVPASWSGRIWGRTLCSQDSATGKFSCATADCGSGAVECSGAGAVPPATLAEFTLNGAGGLDFYDVSLVDGYNLPMLVVPQGGSGGNCSSTGCVSDLNDSCPSELRVVSGATTSSGGGGGEIVACKSACEAFGDPKYCCSGAYATPDTCGPTEYSAAFKNACPRAYSYAYDDKTSTFTCASADYIVTFCPTPSASKKSSGGTIVGAGGVSLVSSGAHFTSSTPSLFSWTLLFFVTAMEVALLIESNRIYTHRKELAGPPCDSFSSIFLQCLLEERRRYLAKELAPIFFAFVAIIVFLFSII